MADDKFIPLSSLPEWMTARSYSPGNFEGRMYAYGSPAEMVEDRRMATVPIQEEKAGLLGALLRNFVPGGLATPMGFNAEMPRYHQVHRSQLMKDAGYSHIGMHRPQGDMPLPDMSMIANAR